MDPQVATWSIDRIESSAWFTEGDSAVVYGSNFAGDTCSFELMRIPDDVVVLDFEVDWYSKDWWESIRPEDIQSDLSDEAEHQLVQWESDVRKILSQLPNGKWRKGPSNDYELEYALLALLTEKLSSFGSLRTNWVVSRLLSIPTSTAVERIRECRNRGLLSSPGQGIRGQSVMTAKARKLLKEKGVKNA